jgi:hypothetical protein
MSGSAHLRLLFCRKHLHSGIHPLFHEEESEQSESCLAIEQIVGNHYSLNRSPALRAEAIVTCLSLAYYKQSTFRKRCALSYIGSPGTCAIVGNLNTFIFDRRLKRSWTIYNMFTTKHLQVSSTTWHRNCYKNIE